MAENEKDLHNAWEDRACKTFSAERKEDIFVLVLAGITVLLVWSGVIGTTFFKSLFY